jgi:2-keto-4-pentenoate hydratase
LRKLQQSLAVGCSGPGVHMEKPMTDVEIADLLLGVRRGLAPARIEVADADQAYAVQRLVMVALGEIGGWKVGAEGPTAAPSCAPMPASHVVPAPHVLDAALFTQREVESEICFTFGADLPPRTAPYGPDEVLTAIATCQPGIEVLQSRLQAPDAAGRLAVLADFIQHGAFVWGEPIADWRSRDFLAMHVRQTIEGLPTIERTGNPAGDMVRLMVWLANEGAAWAGGIRQGQIVTCGSWTGKTRVPEGASAVAEFSGAAPLRLDFSHG